MNNRKNYNSIVFLTTLSVYLGLVLVGGAIPTVLAQAALTRDFDIKNEIVFEDDLDKKPDDDLFVSSIVNLVNELNKFSEQGIFDWNKKFKYQLDGLSFCESDNSPSFREPSPAESILILPESKDSQAYKKIDEIFVSIARNLFNQATNLGLGDFHSHKFDLITLSFESKTLEIEAEFESGNGKNARVFADELTNYLAEITSNSKAIKEKIVAENTKITFENDQVFIITNLPRASIDALLAEKDAQ